MKSKRLPILLYGLDAICLNVSDLAKLSLPVTRAFMKIFRTVDNAIVRFPIFFGILPIRHVIDIRTANFLAKYIDSDNTVCKTLARRSQLNLYKKMAVLDF